MDWLFGACKSPEVAGDVTFADPKHLRPIKLEGPVEVPGMPGMQGMISQPITELSADDWKDFYVWCWKHYSGKCPIQHPGVYTDLGGGKTHRKLLYQATGLMAWVTSVSVELHEVLNEGEKDTLILYNYSDASLKEVNKVRTIRLHREPEFRISVTFEKFPARDSINMPNMVIQQVLDSLGKSKVKINRGQPSPVDEGKLSCVSDALEAGTTIEQVYEQVKKHLSSIKAKTFVVRDDGVFETEVRDGLIRNSGMKSRWFVPKDGILEVLQILPNGELLTTTYVRVCEGPPPVVEAWTIEPTAIDFDKMGENEQDRTNNMLVKSWDKWPGKM
eukprot:CAMPEP_0171059202 /NCGR_PEP_ID=MMETSP0766_2-20121228/3050_1 /TAXON_ID=439317 /ORGANISM="Gambierdiscus australes, Strain CAWD 149" /LENGTH=330 /DNA_ID=CAMNT_0011514623 /DNA_START=58 /DNA_END=1050 /DNA_ORIENTATION=-